MRRTEKKGMGEEDREKEGRREEERGKEGGEKNLGVKGGRVEREAGRRKEEGRRERRRR